MTLAIGSPRLMAQFGFGNLWQVIRFPLSLFWLNLFGYFIGAIAVDQEKDQRNHAESLKAVPGTGRRPGRRRASQPFIWLSVAIWIALAINHSIPDAIRTAMRKTSQ